MPSKNNLYIFWRNFFAWWCYNPRIEITKLTPWFRQITSSSSHYHHYNIGCLPFVWSLFACWLRRLMGQLFFGLPGRSCGRNARHARDGVDAHLRGRQLAYCYGRLRPSCTRQQCEAGLSWCGHWLVKHNFNSSTSLALKWCVSKQIALTRSIFCDCACFFMV